MICCQDVHFIPLLGFFTELVVDAPAGLLGRGQHRGGRGSLVLQDPLDGPVRGRGGRHCPALRRSAQRRCPARAGRGRHSPGAAEPARGQGGRARCAETARSAVATQGPAAAAARGLVEADGGSGPECGAAASASAAAAAARRGPAGS